MGERAKAGKAFGELGPKRQKQLLSQGVAHCVGITGLSWPQFVAASFTMLEPLRHQLSSLFALLPESHTRQWSLEQLHKVALTASEVAEMRDVIGLSEMQVRGAIRVMCCRSVLLRCPRFAVCFRHSV